MVDFTILNICIISTVNFNCQLSTNCTDCSFLIFWSFSSLYKAKHLPLGVHPVLAVRQFLDHQVDQADQARRLLHHLHCPQARQASRTVPLRNPHCIVLGLPYHSSNHYTHSLVLSSSSRDRFSIVDVPDPPVLHLLPLLEHLQCLLFLQVLHCHLVLPDPLVLQLLQFGWRRE